MRKKKLADDEMVDIVDEQENILEQTTKSSAHKKGLLHLTVIAELRCKDGRIILVKQASDRQDAGQFVSPVGGHVKADEDIIEALKREALEETGLENFEYRLIGKKIFNREVLGRKENHLFIVFEIFVDDIPLLGGEAVDYQFFTEQEIKRLMKENPKYFGDAYHFVVKNFYTYLLN